jgi:PAS domain S-box-containing protein
MNNAVTWPGAIPDIDADTKISVASRPVIVAVLLLALGLGGSMIAYFQECRVLAELTAQSAASSGPELSAALLKQTEHWLIWLLGTTALGGLGFLGALAAAGNWWRRDVLRRMRDHDVEWRKATVALHCQFTDYKQREEQYKQRDDLLQNSEAELKKQVAALSYAHAQAEAELNQLKRTEKNLSQQRQSLEVSKNVLEIHVEARTKELQKLQRRYEHILNSAGEGICGVDLDGKTIFANPAVGKMTGWEIEEVIGKTEQEIFGLQAPGGGAVPQNPGEQVFRRKDGARFVVESVRTPINENGRVTGSVLVFKDITERKRSEEILAQRAAELSRSNAELEQFAFVASHDLQEPLRKIQAFGDRLKTKCQGAIAAEAHDYLERMQNASARMRTLIDDLLTFSRVIRRTEPFAPVCLKTVSKEVLGDLEVRIEKTGAQIEVGELPTIEADPLQIRQLFLNLLSNALKFQAPKAQPVILIYSRNFNLPSGEEMCELSVEDNGIGFDEKYLDKVFAVFQRLHGRTEYEGTGVGLAVCRRITDRHHGSITARSEPGKGSTFIVTLPLRQPSAEK